jgi:hypothetical protein
MTQPFTDTNARKGHDRRQSADPGYAGHERRLAERRQPAPASPADGG